MDIGNELCLKVNFVCLESGIILNIGFYFIVVGYNS